MRPHTGSGYSVWDHSSPWPPADDSPEGYRSDEDLLPLFSVLSNDEDRERKAESKAPGTYHVVANPDSFSSLEEYAKARDDEPDLRSTSCNYSKRGRGSFYGASPNSRRDSFEDPDTLILGSFEENVRKLPSLGLPTTHFESSRSSSLVSHSPATSQTQSAQPYRSHDFSPFLETVWEVGEDQHIALFYGTFVRSQLNQVHRDSLGTTAQSGMPTIPDVLDQQAAHFTPLYHALMAFSALSMAHSQGLQDLHALQHYSKTLPLLQRSLHTDEDLSSDGALLTHFLLLLYEVTATGPRATNLWSQHLHQLLSIITLRREMYGPECHEHVMWWIFAIDTHSVLTGSGKGEFAESMLKSGVLLSTVSHGQAFSSRILSITDLSSTDQDHSILDFHRAILTIAARLGLLARDLRAEYTQVYPRQAQSGSLGILRRQQRVTQLQDILRQTWHGRLPAIFAMGHGNKNVPVAARGIFEHTFALYHACMIYSYTSMWPHQRLDMSIPTTPEMSQSVDEILQLGRQISAHGCNQRKFMVFPLFMVGIAAHNPADQQLTIRLLNVFEHNSIGKAIIATRQILEMIYQQQRAAIMQGSHPNMVDWVNTVAERGLKMIDARL